ncbi:transcription factor TFIIIB subunit brf1 [Ascosphaera atra]|nr:transcription factor TFIIIB subunit brf1 [Ascosphaera atra]
MNPIDPESLIYRFAKQLEFGPSTMQVAGEAVRIVQRMNRDWMITGRRPAGICGAALILAARMNNFRRTVREVVYVVKVTELTIQQRLNEFSNTESAHLTIDQFRSMQLETASDPPAFTRARQGKTRSRQVARAPETAAEIENGERVEESAPHAQRKNRVDADGFAIPDVPVDPAITETSEDHDEQDETQSRKRGRPKGSKTMPIVFSEEELQAETALENEMSTLLAEGSMYPNESGQDTISAPRKAPESVPSSTEIDETEFESDPEVRYCLLSPAEVEIKERIWVHDNKDYLRTQQAKALKRALMEEEAAANGGVKPKQRKRRKARRMGDVGYLNEGEEGDGTRASTPAEATKRMLEKRGFSKKINYRLFEGLYEDNADDQKEGMAESARASRAGSVFSEAGVSERKFGRTSASPAPSLTGSNAAPRFTRIAGGITPPPTAPQPSASAAAAVAKPKDSAAAQPTPPDTNEEILGEVPEAENQRPDGAEVDVGDFDDEEGEGDYEDDGVDAAFAGNYYDEGGSDYDWD